MANPPIPRRPDASKYVAFNIVQGQIYTMSTNDMWLESGNNGTDKSKLKFVLYSVIDVVSIMLDGVVLKQGETFSQADLEAGKVTIKVKDGATVTQKSYMASFDTYEEGIKAETVPFYYNVNIVIPDLPPDGSVSDHTVTEDDTVPPVISKTNISFTDPNSILASKIIFEVQTNVRYGVLQKKTATGWNKIIGSGDTFTQDDVNKGLIRYVNENAKRNAPDQELDFFTFKAKDDTGLMNTQTFTLNIHILQVEKPTIKPVLKIQPLEVDKGKDKQVNLEPVKNIEVTDPDSTADKLLFTVINAPKYGDMKLNGIALSAGAQFTYADVLAGKLKYQHKGGTETSDEFSFDLTDSDPDTTADLTNQLLPIIIKQPANMPPSIEIQPVQAPKCGAGAVTGDNIKITDPEELAPEKISISITTLVANGTLMLNGKKLAVGDKFTYADVLAGDRLVYQHNCSKVLTDSFKIAVNDTANTVPATVPVVISEKITEPPFVVKNSPLGVKAEAPRGDITRTLLDFSDKDSDPAQVILTITKLPTEGVLKAGAVDVTLNQTFKLSEWATTKLSYTLNDTSVAVEDKFEFTLVDEDTENHLVGPFEFKILIAQPLPCTLGLNNAGYSVYKFTDKKIIPNSALKATTENPMTGTKDLVFKVIELPTAGDLYLNSTKLAVGATFTQADIDAMRLSYTHLDANAKVDLFKFDLDEGKCSVKNRKFNINILNGMSLAVNPITINKCGVPVIAETNIRADSHRVSGPEDIKFTVRNLPLYGSMKLNDVVMGMDSEFTQADINAGLLKYEHSCDDVATLDYFEFSASDGTETLDGQLVINIIQPEKDNPPTLINNGLLVPELKCADIGAANLYAMDDKATKPELVFTIVDPVTNGTLTKSGAPLVAGDSFSVLDIDNGVIRYCETNMGELHDEFKFTLSDGPNVLPVNTFNITIAPPPPSNLVVTGFSVQPCSKQGLTTVVMRVDSPPEGITPVDIVFTVTSLPKLGKLTRAGVELGVNDSFTQLDVQNGLVVYENSQTSAGTDKFSFSWQAGRNTGDGEFTVNILYVNNPPWLGTLNQLVMNELETKAINGSNLQIYDIDLDSDGPTNVPPTLSSLNYNESHGTVSQVWTVTPGNQFNWDVKVFAGNVRLVITDNVKKMIVDTTCISTNKSGSFTIGASVYDITVQVFPTCKAVAGATSYQVSVTKN